MTIYPGQCIKVYMRPPTGSPEHKEYLASKIITAAEDLELNVRDLTRDGFRQWIKDNDEVVTDYDIYTYGSWAAIKAYAWDIAGPAHEATPSGGELGQKRAVAHANTHRRALERQIGDVEYIYERLVTALQTAVEKNPPILTKLPKPKIKKEAAQDKAIVLHISDTHFGIVIDEEEVLGNKFDWTIASRRLAYLAKAVIEFGKDFTKLVIVLNGDVIEGKIHNDDNGVDLLAEQCDGTRQLLTSLIDLFRSFFDTIEVYCTSGNHGRWPFKGPGRATAQKYDSASTLIYRGLEAIFRDIEDVTFSIPKTPFSVFDVCGHTVFATHGDTNGFEIGNPGKSISTDKLRTIAMTIECSKLVGSPEIYMVGHYHFPMWCRIPNGPDNAHFMINGSLSGIAAYANSIGIYSGTPVQTFFVTTDKKAVESFHQIDLHHADKDESLNKLIPVPAPLGTSVLPRAANTDFYALLEKN